MYIKESKKEIVLTKAEYAKAMKVGTAEFEELLKAKQLCPHAKITIKKTNNKSNYKKLDKKFMLAYVEANDKNYLDEFRKLFESIGCNYFDEIKNEVKTISFFYIRNLFLNKYPQFMTEADRKKYEATKETEKKATEKKSEENTNVIEMKKDA